ncbi:MAG: hypothetical protein OXG62_05365 [Nitrospinae bacterium]|nr:hypothetical protein [Nitrospinota bacterium]
MNKNPEKDHPEATDQNSPIHLLKRLVQAMAKTTIKSLIVYGGPGTGKTRTVAETLREEGLVQNEGWFVIRGGVTPFAIYQILFKHRKGDILVFKDIDSIWNNRKAVSMLKYALDDYDDGLLRSNYDKCIVRWDSTRTRDVFSMTQEGKEKYNEEVDEKIRESSNDRRTVKLPSEFIFRGKAIFISNLPRRKFPPEILEISSKIGLTPD